MKPDYAELHALSNFSFLRGASHPEELVARASLLGYTALAITDECTVSGVVRAHVAAKSTKLKLIIGSEFTLEDGGKLVLLAASRRGYARLCALITQARRRAVKGRYCLRMVDLAAQPMTDCLCVMLSQMAWPDDALRVLKACFPVALWIAVEQLKGADDMRAFAQAMALATTAGLPAVATGHVLMHEKRRKPLQDVLTAIRLRKPLAELGLDAQPNAEQALRPINAIADLYPPELMAETLVIADRCRFSLDELRYEYPQEIVPPGETPASHLRRLTFDGLVGRYARPSISARMQGGKKLEGVAHTAVVGSDGSTAHVPVSVVALIERELLLIRDLAYEPFFLTVHDIVGFARGQGILCQGRGSAANSAVCYCLGITEIDPGRIQVLFERFISKERNEPPDIDVDFEHERREEVIQYLYRKYGRERTALAASLTTYRPRSALKDVGKALGLSIEQAEQLAKTVQWWDDISSVEARLAEVGLDAHSPAIRQTLQLTRELIGFPRHLSQHVGGFVIAAGPLSELVPIENAAMPERTVIQWDKDDLDTLGLLKVDVLALGMLTAIRRTLDVLNVFQGRDAEQAMRVEDIPAEDPVVYDMVCKADTVGVFQIESRAQMSMLPRLLPRCFYDLVIEVAIVRPGPIQGGMVHPYLRRRQGLEPVSYPSETVRGVLERTLGVSIFQEQAMQLVVAAANFTPGESDQLRRAMAAWKRKGGLAPFRDKMLAGMAQNGYTPEFAESLYKQIQGFGEYGFPESHAASFALLVYVSCWLKCHHPAAFACGLLNSQPMGFYAPSQLVQDAQRHGVTVRAVDVTASDWDCALEVADAMTNAMFNVLTNETGNAPRPALRLGFRLVDGLAREAGLAIVAARASAPFQDIADLKQRVGLQRCDMDALARADAFLTLAGHRREAYWQALGLETALALEGHVDGTIDDRGITRTINRTITIRPDSSAADLVAAAEGHEIVMDYAATGLTLRRHPLALLRPRLAKHLTAERIGQLPDRAWVRVSGIVTCRQRPGTAKGTVFVTLEDETGSINVIVWRDLVELQRRELLSARLLGVYGQLQRQGIVLNLVARRLFDHTALLGRLGTTARNFH